MAKKDIEELLDKGAEHERQAEQLMLTGDIHGARALFQMAESYLEDALELADA